MIGTRLIRRWVATQVKNLPEVGRVRISPGGQAWKSVIGLEIHAQIKTKHKLFSWASTEYGAPTNTQVSLFDASIPGTLPILNPYCVDAAVRTALALNCQVNDVSYFDRKHYFYADLPNGFQITQQRRAIATRGQIDFMILKNENVQQSYQSTCGITQVQLEQDSGKSLHDDVDSQSLIDLNRAGVGLMEIVMEPELFDGEEAAALIKELQLILEKLDTCSCRMEQGAFRVDANISVNRPGDEFGVRTEVKNLNSVRSVCNAIEYEIGRQIGVLETGGVVENETMSFDAVTKETLTMRDKEKKQDYRFMPEPNLPPLILSRTTHPVTKEPFDVAQMQSTLPEMPYQARSRIIRDHGLSPEMAGNLIIEPEYLKFFEDCVRLEVSNKTVLANLLLYEVVSLAASLNLSLSSMCLTPSHLVELCNMKVNKVLPHGFVIKAMEILMQRKYQSAEDLVKEQKWIETMRDPERIRVEVENLIENYPKVVKKFLKAEKKKAKEDSFKKLTIAINKQIQDDVLDMAFVVQKLREKLESTDGYQAAQK